MQRKTVLFTGLILVSLVAAFYSYIAFRQSSFNARLTSDLAQEAATIASGYEKEIAGNKPSRETLLPVFTALAGEYSGVAMLAATDKRGSLILVNKNRRFVSESEIYNGLTNDILKKDFSAGTTPQSHERYYQNRRFYIIPVTVSTGLLFIVYPHAYPSALLIQLLLELLVVFMLVIIFWGLIYVLVNKRIQRTAATDSPDEEESAPSEHSPEGDIYALFSKVQKAIGADRVSLIVTGSTPRVFELNGTIFSRTSPDKVADAERITALLPELEKGSLISRNKGKRLLVPVRHKESLLGILDSERKTAFTAQESTVLQQAAKSIASRLSNAAK